MSEKEKVNTKVACALTFREAYLILKKDMNNGITTMNFKKMGLFVPVAVNCSFSCEMFLKSLLHNVRGHKLQDLFGDLKEQTKSDLISKVITNIGNDYTEADFYSDLDNNGNNFVDWRYFYEKSNNYNFKFMDAFHEALFKFIVENNVGKNTNPDF